MSVPMSTPSFSADVEYVCSSLHAANIVVRSYGENRGGEGELARGRGRDKKQQADGGKCDVCRSHKEQEGWKEKLESRVVQILTTRESWFKINWLSGICYPTHPVAK